VSGRSDRGEGVHGESNSLVGVLGHSTSGVGVKGSTGDAVFDPGLSDIGVYGKSDHGYGVFGQSEYVGSIGVLGHSFDGTGVRGMSESGTGVYGTSADGFAAAYLNGRVKITGYLEKAGGGLKIDHPVDPANKYLCHSFVESPELRNIYDGVVALDDNGEAEIELPDWFGALNKDFRYQLTAIGAPGPNLYIAEEISEVTATSYSDSSNNNNSSNFKIAGGNSGMKVSWQVTGIRKDPWANANRIQVEEDKPAKERGYYLHPDLYGQPEEKGISHLLFPKEKQELLVNKNKHSRL
jgi:hypothetical protein